MDPREHVSASLAVLGPLVDGIRPDQLQSPTPCPKWTVADLVGHVTGGGHFFAGALRGEAPSTEEPPPPADIQAAYHGAVAEFDAAVAGLDDLERPVTLPFGTMPAGAVLRLAACDLLVHAWDLASATGQPIAPPAALLDETEPTMRAMIDPNMRDGDVFADEVVPPDGAGTLERIIAFSGRSVGDQTG
jgi:uncharacterized protein (TIGR03086 family)